MTTAGMPLFQLQTSSLILLFVLIAFACLTPSLNISVPIRTLKVKSTWKAKTVVTFTSPMLDSILIIIIIVIVLYVCPNRQGEFAVCRDLMLAAPHNTVNPALPIVHCNVNMAGSQMLCW